MVGWLGLIGLLVDLDVLVVFTNAAACSSGCCFLISTVAAASGGLQPVKVVAPYGVSGVKLDNACPWLLYSCLSVIQENAPRTVHTMILEGGFLMLFSRLDVWKMQAISTHAHCCQIGNFFLVVFTSLPFHGQIAS